MFKRKNLPLEEKLKISIDKLPFSREVKNELLKKGNYSLRQIYEKFNSAPGRITLPGYTKRVYEETSYLIANMDFYPPEHEIPHAASTLKLHKEKSLRGKIEELETKIKELKKKLPEAKKKDQMYAQIKTRIDDYVNKEICSPNYPQ
jgi:hypothetical protein